MGGISAALRIASLATPGTAMSAHPVPATITAATCVLLCVMSAVRGERLRNAEVLAIALFIDAVIAYIGLLVAEQDTDGDAMLLLTWPWW